MQLKRRMNKHRYYAILCYATGLSMVVLSGCMQDRPGAPGMNSSAAAVDKNQPICYWRESLQFPRPVKLHFCRVDLNDPAIEIVAMVSEDPDGSGPAEASLVSPLQLAKKYNAIAAVNANAFRSLLDADGKRDTEWFEGKPVDIAGLTVMDGQIRSQNENNRIGCWIGSDRNVHFGDPDDDGTVYQAISDWNSRLIENGAIVVAEDNLLHPRTLLGIDKSGRWLLLVVADGRQEGYSEGISLCAGSQED